MNGILLAVGWGVLGAVVGAGIRFASVWLARKEELEPGHRRWQVYGPGLLAAVLFAAFAYRLGLGPALVIRSLWIAVLVQVIFFDLEHYLILDRVLLPSYLAAIALSFVTPHLGVKMALITGVVAGVGFLALAVVGAAVFRAEALGLGDVKFSVLMGLILGLQPTLKAVVAGVFLAGTTSIVLLLFRLRGRKDAIAYGPFLAAGALIVLFQLPAG